MTSRLIFAAWARCDVRSACERAGTATQRAAAFLLAAATSRPPQRGQGPTVNRNDGKIRQTPNNSELTAYGCARSRCS